MSWKNSWNVMEFGFENCVGTLLILHLSFTVAKPV